MKVNRWIIGAFIATISLLVFFWWDRREPVLQEPKPVVAEEERPHRKHRNQSHQHSVKDDCASCPNLPKPDVENQKRPGITAEQFVEMRREAQYEAAERIGGCYGLLLKAGLDGNPNPKTDHLDGCGGKTPLHIANTPEMVRDLIEAGADVNAQDEFGATPLHKQAAMSEPTEETLEMVRMLLDAGADAQIKNQTEEAPWKTARLMASTEISHLTVQEQLEKDALDHGMSVEAFMDANPGRKARLERILEGYLYEAKIKRLLLRSAIDPEQLEILDEQRREILGD